MEQSDLLMLLAAIANGLGADMDDYEIPADRLAEFLAGRTADGRPTDPDERRLQVAAAAAAVGGEVG